MEGVTALTEAFVRIEERIERLESPTTPTDWPARDDLRMDES